MGFVIGIDSSTTATKALLVDERGTVVASSTHGYDFDTPRPGWTEQHPSLWWEATVASLRAVLSGINPSEVEAIGLTGQMHGLVLLDADGEVLRPAILWNDQRTAAECDAIRERIGAERLVALTGNDAMTGFTAPKVAWVGTHEPDVLASTAHVLLPKDYVRFQLTGGFATDVADASGTLLLDVRARTWSEEVVAVVGLRPDQLPGLHEGPDVTGTITAEAAEATGLLAGTPVVGGGGDQAANAVGVGAVTPAVGALSLGTSGVVFVPTDSPPNEARGRTHAFCHSVPGRWHAMGVMLSAAGSLEWYRSVVAPGVPFDELVKEAAGIPPGAEGLRFLPYLSGERTPHPDPDIRGGFIGLGTHHERAHLTRAVLEGVAFGLADGLGLMVDAGVRVPEAFRASGGGTRSPLWLQIVADALGTAITTIGTAEGAAFGAALLAGVGAGWWDDVEASCSVVVEGGVTSPGVHDYGSIHASYRSLYPTLAPHFPLPT